MFCSFYALDADEGNQSIQNMYGRLTPTMQQHLQPIMVTATMLT